MKNIDNSEIESIINNLPDELAKLITGLLDDKNYAIKHNARETLVKEGKRIIPQLHKLLISKNILLRKEAAKVVELIADRKSIPLLINLLDDTESDIRWIAAEGLIKIGRQSILPLLKSISDKESSHLLYKSAHHVLLGLINVGEMDKLKPLLLSLDDYHQLGETAPVEASLALKTFFKSDK